MSKRLLTFVALVALAIGACAPGGQTDQMTPTTTGPAAPTEGPLTPTGPAMTDGALMTEQPVTDDTDDTDDTDTDDDTDDGASSPAT